jgi:tripartite-type tricarboxylate transporter receptor subunit TctC
LQSVINDKKVRVTAVSGEKRISLLANVPTAEESGFPDFVVVGWNALTAPAGLPVDVLRILNREVNSALADPEVRQKTEGLGMIARGSTPQEMQDCDLKRRGSYQSTCGRRISFFGAAVALAPSN